MPLISCLTLVKKQQKKTPPPKKKKKEKRKKDWACILYKRLGLHTVKKTGLAYFNKQAEFITFSDVRHITMDTTTET